MQFRQLRLCTSFTVLATGCAAGGASISGSQDGSIGDASVSADRSSGPDGQIFGAPVKLVHGTSTAIAAGQNFPDPGIAVSKSRIYRFSTNGAAGHVPSASADSIGGPWSELVDALPTLPGWALSHVWAPEVVEIYGHFYMYYAATIANDGSPYGEHAIGVAEANTANGPFSPVGNEVLLRDGEGNGVLDPDVVEIDERRWLIWSTDWGPAGRGSEVMRTIKAQELVSATTLGGPVIELLRARKDSWEQGTVEAPAMVSGPDGRLHLLYSGGNFEDSYRIGYAICPREMGPCERVSDGPWLDQSPSNPGGLDIITAEDGRLVGFHHGGSVALRELYTVPLNWQ